MYIIKALLSVVDKQRKDSYTLPRKITQLKHEVFEKSYFEHQILYKPQNYVFIQV